MKDVEVNSKGGRGDRRKRQSETEKEERSSQTIYLQN